jgi:quercetin dioxygenase-like cupin family protein
MKKLAVPLALLAALSALAGDEAPAARHSLERDGAPIIIHGADLDNPRHLWPLYSTPEARMNYFEVTGRAGLHFHPDADHRLYVLEGSLLVTVGTNTITANVGDFIVIPKGVRHGYDVPAKGGRALLLTFDAPPYDPRKTVNVEPTPAGK